MMHPVPTKFTSIKVHHYVGWHNATNDLMKYRAISGISEQQLRKVKLEDINTCNELFEEALKESVATFKPIVTLSGKDYGLIPNFKNISAAEFVDLVEFTKPAAIFDNLAKALCILYRPVNAKLDDKYDIEVYDSTKHMDNESVMLMMPMDIVQGALVFFSIVANDLQRSSLTFLEQKMEELMKTVEELKNEQ
jgi:hypothetical protein